MSAAGTKGFYYSAHKAELEGLLAEIARARPIEAYVFRPCIVAGADAPTLIGMLTTGNRLDGRARTAAAGARTAPGGAAGAARHRRPVPARPPRRRRSCDRGGGCGGGRARGLQPRCPDEVTTADLARELGWATVPVPKATVAAVAAAIDRAPLTPSIAEWINAFRTPVLMDSSKAEHELGLGGWRSAAETLTETVAAARESGRL